MLVICRVEAKPHTSPHAGASREPELLINYTKVFKVGESSLATATVSASC